MKVSNYFGSPCLSSTGKWHYFDADFNTRFPWGTSMCLRAGRQHKDRPGGIGFTLDVNAPLGEPNRLYVWGPRRNYMLGLVGWHKEVAGPEVTHRGITLPSVRQVRCRPHLTRGQRWDWAKSEGWDYRDDRAWRWFCAYPNDRTARWEAAHPEEAAELKGRHG